MKFKYKVLIVLAVFIGAMFYFGSDISETFFGTQAATTMMSDSTLPTVSIEVGGNEINRLHGYVSNLDEMLVRETITPITSDRVFTVFIHENESNVKKLKYEIINSDGREVESDTYTVLDVEDGPKKVEIALKETMKSGQEYICKITLITNLSKRIYYYTRIKMYDNGHLYEKLNFATEFRDILLGDDEQAKEGLKKYLESSKRYDNSTYSYVTIKSSFSMVTWGELEPNLIWAEIPTITEFYDSMATIELKYVVSIDIDGTLEYYVVKDHYRFNYTSLRTYLYNYERTMEAVFDVANTSLMKDEFKLGITNDTDAQTGASDSHKYLAFVYGRELMLYDVEQNNLIKVFSFRQNNGDYARDFYDQHAVDLIRVHDNGDVDFMVYGYMNRGEYEGRVGIILYRYVHEDLRIEEQLYIPVNSSYQLLEADMTDFAYLGERDVFYFSLYESIYSFDLVTKKLTLIASDVPERNLIFCEEENYLAWQDCSDDTQAKRISVLDLLSGDTHVIEAREGDSIRIYGRINNNIIYGFSHSSDRCILADGSTLLPAYRLCIEDGYGNVLKTYEEEGFYIDGIEIGANILTLNRLKKVSDVPVKYGEAEDDTILNRLVTVTRPVSISKRITDRILTEYYVSLPSSVDIETVPTLSVSLSTVINHDTTTRVSEPEDRTGQYYAYSFGTVAYSSVNVADVVAAADTGVGTVIASDGRLVWERGIKSARSDISSIKPVNATDVGDSIKASMKMLLDWKGITADVSTFDTGRTSVSEWLESNTKLKVLNLSGASLDEVLYYVYKSRPVIAFKQGGACVITGYDAVSVTVYDPSSKKSVKYQIKEAISMFEKEGNMFISYID